MEEPTNEGIKERIYLNQEGLEEIETRFSEEMHVRRYVLAKMYSEGSVLDIACGCGYGSYLIQKSEFVTLVTGIDKSEEAIKWARKNFAGEKATFGVANIENYIPRNDQQFDTVVCLEVIEHMKDPETLRNLILKINAPVVLISYPMKRTKHYNKFHHHDITFEDIKRLFQPMYMIVDKFEYFREFEFIILKRV